MKQTNKDNYDLNSSSPKGEIGFEPFRTDKHYYFHFNNEKGDCILFSQAYKSKKGADNGMVSIKKNIKHKDHVLLHHNDDLHYFTIKAGNNQEVARSRNFDTFEDMEKGLHFLYSHLGCTYESHFLNNSNQHKLEEVIAENESLTIQLQEKVQIETELREKLWELETALAETTSSLNQGLLQQEEWEKEKGILEEKLVLLTKKISDLDHSHVEEQNAIEEFQGSTYGFRIDFYNIDTPEDVKVTIYQPLSREKKVMKGLQKDAIFEFITKRLPSTIFEETIEKEFDEISITTIAGNSSRSNSRHTVATVATKSIPVIQEIREPASLAVTVEEIIPEESTIEMIKESIVERGETTKIAKKKVRNIYQMKAMVEDIRKDMATNDSIPKWTKKIVTASSNPEELAADQSAEDIRNIEQFFGDTEATNKLPNEELEPMAYLVEKNVEQLRDEAEVSEQTIRQFFPPQIEEGTNNIASRTISDIPTNLEVMDLSEEELAIIKKFFSIKSNEPRTTPLNLSEIQTLLDNATAENSTMSKEDIATIKQFFPMKSVEKIAVQTRATFKLPLPAPQIEISKAEEEIVTQFFGNKQKKGKAKSRVETQAEIVASILSNIKEDPMRQPVDKELVKKFFGEKKRKKVIARAISKTKNKPLGKEYQFNQPTNKKAGSNDIALFNKWFGK